jgi:hypothetical protein
VAQVFSKMGMSGESWLEGIPPSRACCQTYFTKGKLRRDGQQILHGFDREGIIF